MLIPVQRQCWPQK